MVKIIAGSVSTLLIIFIVPMVVYGLLSGLLQMKTPEGVSSVQFLAGVFISKIGMALLLTLLFYLGRDVFYDKWLLYAGIFFVMFVFGEIGQAIGPNYSWNEAIAGIISEAIYVPLSVFVLRLIMK